ncbi:MAG TPA: hypothetical protein VFY15_05990 [Acidimicrobiia bacterium]|nr:hypothetical protein [Acidimicrobiia bacterium]
MPRIHLLAVVLLLVTAACGDDPVATTSDGELFGVAVLDELAERCEGGDFVSCDVLYQASDVGSAYETLGNSCGGRGIPDEAYCAPAYDVTPDLADARAACASGDMFACDVLYIYSPIDSADEAYGDSCGSRGDEGRSCAVSHGWTP